MRILALSYPPYGPCADEALAAEMAGWEMHEEAYESVDWESCEASIILNVGGWPIDDRKLASTGCRYLIGYGVGTDYVDQPAASRRGVSVINMPTSNVTDVAVHTLALILSCVRRLGEHDRSVRSGRFDPLVSVGLRRLSSMTLGFLAFGNIPRRLAVLAAPLQVRMIAYDPQVHPDVGASFGVRIEPSLEEFLSECDILSVHLPSTPATRGLLTYERLSTLPAGSVVVVTSRGDVYDTAAVSRLLASRHIAAAAFDVFETEPPTDDNPLTSSPFTILTPHVAGNSTEAIDSMHRLAAGFIQTLATSGPEAVEAIRGLTE